MFKVEIIVYDELNDFLLHNTLKKSIIILNTERRSIKDLIESMGIPHTELGRIFVGRSSVNSSFVVQRECQIKVFPFVMDGSQNTCHFFIHDFRFLCDVHLGSLVRNLRLLGFDVAFNRVWMDSELAARSIEEDRIILTRDRHLLMRKNVAKGLYIRSVHPDKQVPEILNRLNLKSRCRPFSRCLACNGILHPVDPDSDLLNSGGDKIPEKVLNWCQEFTACDSCSKVYWKGSHYHELQKKVTDFLA